MTERKTVVYPNPEVLAQAVAARTLLTIADLLAEPNRQRVDIAVTGGTDGIYVLKVMGESPLAEAVDWSRVHVWWGDERFVAADSDDRNAKQAREAWFGKLIEDGRMPAENIHEMPADGRSDDEITTATPEQTDAVLAAAAAEYQRELIEQLGDKPSLDIAMFGVGPDAHFASLFPDHGEAEINDPHVLVVGVRDSPKPPPLRVTLTVPMIAHSKHTCSLPRSAKPMRYGPPSLGATIRMRRAPTPMVRSCFGSSMKMPLPSCKEPQRKLRTGIDGLV